ncbi:MAG: peptidoglycan glycosyltransferase FtsW [Planctomycetaceae bacterium]
MELDRKLFVVFAAVLVGFGILMVQSASITSRPSDGGSVFLSRHLVFVACGLASAVLAGCLPARFWRTAAPWMFWAAIVLLAAVLLPGVGVRVNGAQRWFRLGVLSLQPSEFAKLALPIYICLRMTQRQVSGPDTLYPFGSAASEDVSAGSRSLTQALPILLIVPLVIVQPDLGTALFLAACGSLALWVGGWPIRNFLLLGSAALPAVAMTVWRKPYQMQRIAGFFEAWSDWTQAPYHLKQSLVTLGTGGTWGAGLGRGYQKLSFLPEANTDFVFSVIGEELGLLGTLTVLGLWLALYVCGLRIINHLPAATFEYRAAFTLLTQIVLQAALNVAVVTALVPPKGIPHPLISYGGSNLVVTLTALGVILGLTRGPQQAELGENLTAATSAPDQLVAA